MNLFLIYRPLESMRKKYRTATSRTLELCREPYLEWKLAGGFTLLGGPYATKREAWTAFNELAPKYGAQLKPLGPPRNWGAQQLKRAATRASTKAEVVKAAAVKVVLGEPATIKQMLAAIDARKKEIGGFWAPTRKKKKLVDVTEWSP